MATNLNILHRKSNGFSTRNAVLHMIVQSSNTDIIIFLKNIKFTPQGAGEDMTLHICGKVLDLTFVTIATVKRKKCSIVKIPSLWDCYHHLGQ